MIFTIDNIDFEIIQYNIEETCSNIYYNNSNYVLPNIPKNISITAKTDNKNYIAVQNLFDKILSSSHARYYKYDFNFKYLKINGLFPIDFTFNQYNIVVTFSADYIEGDFELEKKQKIRKEKLKNIEKINKMII